LRISPYFGGGAFAVDCTQACLFPIRARDFLISNQE
jgi:hypothetical protein